MHQPLPVSVPPGTLAVELANKALSGRLTIYAGAGLSAAPPTELPGAARLAKRLADALGGIVDLAAVDPWNLVAVADAVAAEPRGTQVLRDTVLRVADFLGAPANYGHRVIALLICEGAVTALETNYDDCIERAAQPERLPVVRTPTELLHGPSAALLKAHGCATLPPTMLITTADLGGVAFWADATVSAKLSHDHVAFIGIGSVADYVKASIAGVLHATGQEHITLIDPALAHWEDDLNLGWRQLLPDLPDDQRVAEDASGFCDALLRAYLVPFRQGIRQLVSGFDPEHGPRVGTSAVLDALETADAVWVLRWLRDLSWKLSPGTSALAPVTASVLIAAGALLCDEWSPRTEAGGMLVATRGDATSSGDEVGEVLLLTLAVHGTRSGAAAANEARRRLVDARSDQHFDEPTDVVVIVGGHIGDLGLEEVPVERGCSLQQVLDQANDILGQTPHDLVAEVPEDHLIDGPRGGRVILLNAAMIGETREAS